MGGRGMGGGREGSPYVRSPCLSASLALHHPGQPPQATSIRATQFGATQYGCSRANGALGWGREGGVGGGQEDGDTLSIW